MNLVIGLGAGGHAKVCIEVLQLLGDFELVGLLDPKQEIWNTTVLGVTVLGNDNMLPDLRSQGVEQMFIGLGSTKDTQPRRMLYELALANGFLAVRTIHPQAIISSSAQIGAGPTIMANAVINASATLGENVIVNTGAIVEHDCTIGDHVHIATGAKLASTVRVGDGAHIGLGASVRQGISIGEGSVVGAGSVVVDDVASGMVVVGVPARPISRAGLEEQRSHPQEPEHQPDLSRITQDL